MLSWTCLRSGRALTTALAGALLLSGCSLLLPFDIDQLPCDDDGGCQADYFCNDSNVCEREPNLPCSPSCGPLERCERGVCRPQCEGRACAAAQFCDESANATCRPTTSQGTLGSSCTSHNDCRLFGGRDAFCLRAWGGSEASNAGVCTRHCVPGDSQSCGGGQECVTFSNGESVVSLCADPSFMPCEHEGDCTASGLSCGVYVALDSSTSTASTAISACRAPADGPGVGTPGCGAPDTCATDLCIQGRGANAICTTPCAANDECDDYLGGAFCLPVLLDESQADGQPTIRARVCVPTERPMLFQNCTGNSQCDASAPYCLGLPERPGQGLCTTPCVDNRCPEGSVCKETPAGSNIPWPQYCGLP